MSWAHHFKPSRRTIRFLDFRKRKSSKNPPSFQGLTTSEYELVSCIKIIKFVTYSNFILDTGDVEEWSDLLPQFVPWPGTQLEVFAQVSLAHLESQTLLLQFLEFLSREVTTDPRLHPGDDLAKTFVTKFFHLTQDSGTEEYLGISLNQDWYYRRICRIWERVLF